MPGEQSLGGGIWEEGADELLGHIAQHPRAQVGLTAKIGANQLEGHDPLDEDVTGAVNDPHSSFAEPCLEAIAPRDTLSPASIVGPSSRCSPLRDGLFHALFLLPALTCQIRSHNDIGCFSALWSRAGDDVTEKRFSSSGIVELSTMTEQENPRSANIHEPISPRPVRGRGAQHVRALS